MPKSATTSVGLPAVNGMPRVIQLADVQDQTTFIFQQGLLTRIETHLTREEALAMAGVLINHFQLMPNEVAPITLGIDRKKTHPGEPCDHDWVRHLCPDIYQEDYFVCSKCGAQK